MVGSVDNSFPVGRRESNCQQTLGLSAVVDLDPSEIKAMRSKEKLSQSVMAKILNVTPSTYQKWERGAVHPRGANLKLLRLAYDHGIGYIMH